MTTLVTSPAGEVIEVVPDDEFLEIFETTRPDLRQWSKRRPLLSALWIGGPIEDRETGRALTIWAKAAREFGYTATTSSALSGMLLSSKAMAACLEVEKGTKRTYAARLVRLPELYHESLKDVGPRKVRPKPEPAFEPPPEPEVVIEPKPEPEPEPAFNSMEVAQHLLSLLIAKVTEPEPKELAHRLAEQVEYGQRMREEARRQSDRAAALTVERDQLQRDLTLIKTRFDTMLSREQRANLDGQLRRLMEARPSTKGGSDE